MPSIRLPVRLSKRSWKIKHHLTSVAYVYGVQNTEMPVASDPIASCDKYARCSSDSVNLLALDSGLLGEVFTLVDDHSQR